MKATSEDTAGAPSSERQRLGFRLLRWLAAYLLSALIGVAVCVAFFAGNGKPSPDPVRYLDFRTVEDTSSVLGPRQALEQLSAMPVFAGRDTKLSEAPFWFSFAVPPLDSGEAVEVELPSRHAREDTCWNAANLNSLGFADRTGSAGPIRQLKSGFAIRLGNLESPEKVLCRSTFAGPAHISVVQWPESQFWRSLQRFELDAGLLEGALSLLAAYMLILAIIKQEAIYLLCALWLVSTYRLSAVTAGTEYEWFGYMIPPDWQTALRPFSSALVYLSAVALLTRFLRGTATSKLDRSILVTAQWTAILVFAAACILPPSVRLPLLWTCTAYLLVAVVVLLWRNLRGPASGALVLFCLATGISVFTFFYDIVVSALGATAAAGSVNGARLALLSALLMSIAVEMTTRKQEAQKKIAQRAAERSYESSPIGFFRLDSDGKILHSNASFRALLSATIEGRPYTAWSDCFDFAAWQNFRGALLRGGSADFEFSWPAGEEMRLFRVQAVTTGNRIDGAMRDLTGIGARPRSALA